MDKVIQAPKTSGVLGKDIEWGYNNQIRSHSFPMILPSNHQTEERRQQKFREVYAFRKKTNPKYDDYLIKYWGYRRQKNGILTQKPPTDKNPLIDEIILPA